MADKTTTTTTDKLTLCTLYVYRTVSKRVEDAKRRKQRSINLSVEDVQLLLDLCKPAEAEPIESVESEPPPKAPLAPLVLREVVPERMIPRGFVPGTDDTQLGQENES